MKNLFTFIMVMLVSIGYSQSDDDNDSSVSQSKFYLGVGLGMSSAKFAESEASDLKTGLNMNFLNLGYRFSETWGATFNLSSSGHIQKDDDTVAVGIAYLGIGPMYTVSLSERVYWDIKPQYAFNLTATTVEDGVSGDTVLEKGTGFVFGNSLVFGDGGKGFSFSIDLDYLSGNFKQVTDGGVSFDLDDLDLDGGITNFKLGAGIRYNF